MEAMEIYKSLSQPPRDALRTIEAGKLKGKTDINPQWRYKAMTEKFGLVGLGWKYEIQKLWTEQGAGNEKLAFAQVAVFIRDTDTKEWSDAIIGIGGSKLVQTEKGSPVSNDEGYKMAVTDAFSTSLKMIGVAADIYAGKWDGSKYKDQSDVTPSHAIHQTSSVNKGPAGGVDTPEQTKRINQLLSTKNPDGTPVFTKQDCQGITSMRATKTADEVIMAIHQELNERSLAWNKAHPPIQPSFTEKQEAEIDVIF